MAECLVWTKPIRPNHNGIQISAEPKTLLPLKIELIAWKAQMLTFFFYKLLDMN